MPNTDHLQKYPLFEDLTESELAGLLPHIHKRVFAKGVYLFHPGNPGLNLYLVESGMVRLFFAGTRGQEFLLNLAGPRTCVGLPLLMDDQVRIIGAAAHQDAVVLSLSRDVAFDFMKRSPQFMFNIYLQMSNSLRMLGRYTQSIATLSLDGRMASLFLHLNRDNNRGKTNEVKLPVSQAEIAGWVGASRGRVNRVLAKMQELNLIRVEGQKILLLDRQGLEKMAEA